MRFGTCNIPTRGKDHDRTSQRRLDLGDLDGPLLFGFGLFDGHGKTAGVADLLAERVLDDFVASVRGDAVSPFRDAVASPAAGEGVTAGGLRAEHGGGSAMAKVAARHLRKAFAAASAAVAEAFEGQRAGSTATAVVVFRDPAVAGLPNQWGVVCSWVGDSRAVAIAPGGRAVEALTEDHRLGLSRERDRVMKEHAAEAARAPPGARATVVTVRVCTATGRVGPQVAFNERTGISTTVTRAFGDSLGASALTDVPEVAAREGLPDGTRLVVASDGVWDVLSPKRVAEIVRSVRNPRKAACVLCDVAKKVRLFGGHSPDDISATVVDLGSPAAAALGSSA